MGRDAQASGAQNVERGARSARRARDAMHRRGAGSPQGLPRSRLWEPYSCLPADGDRRKRGAHTMPAPERTDDAPVPTVFVVDDDGAVREALARLLRALRDAGRTLRVRP